MARTLTTERNLQQRQNEIIAELSLLQRMRMLEWGLAAVCIVTGLFLKYGMDKGYAVLILGLFIAFLALGHESRRKESARESKDTESMLDAKKKMAALLDEKLANDHFVLNDLRLKVGREKCWIDHLVVAPSGMFVLSTLNWNGTIVGDTSKQAHIWKIRTDDGSIRTVRNPLARTLRERRILCNWLKGTNLIWERVYPLVVLAHPDAVIQVLNAKDRVLTPDGVINFINGFCFEKPILSNAEVEKLANGLNEQQR